ncbi:MAG: amidohydrolase family protein [Rhodospirillales bacterium]
MVRYGMTPMQAIQAATVTSAELLGWQKDVGAVEPGRYADLVAVSGDAMTDITRPGTCSRSNEGRHADPLTYKSFCFFFQKKCFSYLPNPAPPG